MHLQGPRRRRRRCPAVERPRRRAAATDAAGGFSEQEFARLREAQDVSDALVKTEVAAMNAVNGLFDDGQGGFTRKADPNPEFARAIMHDADYHRNKARIMVPLNDFLRLLDERTGMAVAEAEAATGAAMKAAIALMVASIVLTTAALYMVYRYIMRNLNKAVAAADRIAGATCRATSSSNSTTRWAG